MWGIARLMERYGQTVEVRPKGAERELVVRAFLQPVLERREDWVQRMPGPLGMTRRDRFLYLGPPEVDVSAGTLLWRGVRYEVRAAQAVFAGDVCSHWWAVLQVGTRGDF